MINNITNQNIQAVLLALFPILGLYDILPSISIGIILLFTFLLVNLKGGHFNNKIIFYFASILFLSLISYVFSINQQENLFFNNTLQVIMFATLLSYYTTLQASKSYIKALLIIGVLSTIVLFFQTFSYYVLHLPIPFYLPIGEFMTKHILHSSIHWGRPPSFFLEPAHYAIYILPIFYYTLVNNKIIMSLFLLIGLLFSTSTTGFAIAFILIIYSQIKVKREIKYIISIIILGGVLFFLFQENLSLMIGGYLNKLDLNTMDDNITHFGTSYLLSMLDNFSLFFGVGHNQLANFMTLHNLEGRNFANSYFMSIFSYGLLSLIPLFYLLKAFYKENKNKGYFIIFILVLFSDQVLFNQNFFYLVICIYLLKQEQPNNKINYTKNHNN